jgi:tRNA(fMet)-specific endonuclease VapC
MAFRGYLLDTSILSHLIVHPGGPVAAHIAEVGEDAVSTSIIVACELRFGAAKKRSARLTTRVEQLLQRIEVLAFGAEADRRYAELRARLEQRGTPIGPNDMLIAAHALSAERVLVTGNVNEFRRVSGLSVENWLTPSPRIA